MRTIFLLSALSSLFKLKDDGVLALRLSRPHDLSDLLITIYNVRQVRKKRVSPLKATIIV